MVTDSEGDQEGKQKYLLTCSFRCGWNPHSKSRAGFNDYLVESNSLSDYPLCHLLSVFSLPCSLSKWPFLNLFLLPATFFMASCHFLKILYQPHRMELTFTDLTHFGTEMNILYMQIVSMSLPTSAEGFVVNSSRYSTWKIIIVPYLVLPHKLKRHSSAYLFNTNQQMQSWRRRTYAVTCSNWNTPEVGEYDLSSIGIMLPRVFVWMTHHCTIWQCRAQT